MTSSRELERARAQRYYSGRGRHTERLRKYGLNKEEVEALLEVQGGRCAICGAAEPGGRWLEWSLDHDHNADRPRGLLCHRCNHGLGNFRDDPELLKAAIVYLRRANSKRSPVQRALALVRKRRRSKA